MHKSESFIAMSDDQLVIAMEAGDLQAFEEIFERYWKNFYIESYKRIKDIKVVEGIVQDVFSGLWINKGQEKIEDLETFLKVAFRYRILSVYYKTGKLDEMKLR